MSEVGEKQETIKKFQTHKTDTGSPEVQIALLTSRITALNDHFKAHKHDHSSRRGLLKLVGRRRDLLGYLKARYRERYDSIIEQLKIRK